MSTSVKVRGSDWSEAKGETTQINIQAEDPGARVPERSDEAIKLEQLNKLSDVHVSGAAYPRLAVPATFLSTARTLLRRRLAVAAI